jgi:hypothetical protein
MLAKSTKYIIKVHKKDTPKDGKSNNTSNEREFANDAFCRDSAVGYNFVLQCGQINLFHPNNTFMALLQRNE